MILPGARLEHPAGRTLRHPVGGGEVGVDHRREVVLAHPQQQPVVRDAGVGHEDLDGATELGLDGVEGGVDIVARRDVALDREDAGWRGSGVVGDRDPIALGGEPLRGRQPDARGSRR